MTTASEYRLIAKNIREKMAVGDGVIEYVIGNKRVRLETLKDMLETAIKLEQAADMLELKNRGPLRAGRLVYRGR